MTGSAVLALERREHNERRDAALARLAGRAGTEPPKIRDVGRPKPTPEYQIGDAATFALLAEAIANLADEVDELRSQLAKKGAR